MSAPTIKDEYSLLVRKIAAAPRPIGWGTARSIFREFAALGRLDFDPERLTPKEWAAIAREINADRDGAAKPAEPSLPDRLAVALRVYHELYTDPSVNQSKPFHAAVEAEARAAWQSADPQRMARALGEVLRESKVCESSRGRRLRPAVASERAAAAAHGLDLRTFRKLAKGGAK